MLQDRESHAKDWNMYKTSRVWEICGRFAGKRFKTRRMAITANPCYNSHTPISLGVSYVSVQCFGKFFICGWDFTRFLTPRPEGI